jgi:hypothetical protein
VLNDRRRVGKHATLTLSGEKMLCANARKTSVKARWHKRCRTGNSENQFRLVGFRAAKVILVFLKKEDFQDIVFLNK